MTSKSFPQLTTKRLFLRPFTLADAVRVRQLAGDREIALNTLAIPHPYEDGMAEHWIGNHQERFESVGDVTLAITLREDNLLTSVQRLDEPGGRPGGLPPTGNLLIGAISLMTKRDWDSAEMGYWVGKEYWGKGYCTEAAGAVLDYGFTVAGFNRIYASYLDRNPASGRVMEKIGMVYEGCRRQHIKKWGEYVNLIDYGILKSEYLSRKK